MAKMLSLCVLLVAHAFAVSALSLGGVSIPIVSSLPGVPDLPSADGLPGVSDVSPDGLPGVLPGAPAVSADGLPIGASGILGLISSNGGLAGLGVSPLDPALGPILDALDPVSPLLNQLGSDLVFNLADVLDLSDLGLVKALEDPLGLADITNQLTTSLLGVVGNITSLVIPDELAYGRDPDVEARRFGLITERVTITTPDGYILTLFRFRSACTIPGRVVILTSTGISNSANFILLQEESLAYKLAWQCNDVWIVPFRGSRWAAQNTKLQRDSTDFWNSTLLELGIYDLRVSIEHISECTGSTSIRLITADIGSSAFVIMNSVLGVDSPQCKLGQVYIIEPFICLQHTSSIFFAALKLVRDVLSIAGNLVLNNHLPLGDKPIHPTLTLLCGVVSAKTCDLLNKVVFGVTSFMDTTNFLYKYGYIFDNIQMPAAVHLFQNMRSDQCLRLFNYGSAGNQEVYGSDEPTLVDISASTVSISLYVNDASSLMGEEDWHTTYESFPASARNRFFVIKGGNFLTTFIPKNPDAFLYDKLLADMEDDYRSDCIAACTKPCRSCK